eukprot:10724773-Heterocapsa_arctica.AAC.1
MLGPQRHRNNTLASLRDTQALGHCVLLEPPFGSCLLLKVCWFAGQLFLLGSDGYCGRATRIATRAVVL